MIRRSRLCMAALLIAAAACSGDGTAPTAGTLTVSLTTPNPGQDEALLLVVTSPVPPGGGSTHAAGGLVLWGGVSGTADTLALTGTVNAGSVLTVTVNDVNQVSQYHVQLLQVAAAGSHALRSLAGYSLKISK